ncbi:MAG: hypothetical protein RLZZ272_1416 [Actinomycetota bacterium]
MLIARGLLVLVAALGLVAGAMATVLDVGVAPVLSPSMRPAFAEGDLLVVRPVDTAMLEIGQVVLLAAPDAASRTFAHRIVELEHGEDGTIVRTRGDANPDPDRQRQRITSERTTVVVGRIPVLGHAAAAVDGPGRRAALGAAVLVLVVVAARRALQGLRRP